RIRSGSWRLLGDTRGGKLPTESGDRAQAGTGTQEQKRGGLGCRHWARGKVALDDCPVEEQIGALAELVEPTVVEIGEREDCVELLVGAQTTAQRVEQGERDVIRAGTDVIGVVERTRENIAQEAPEWIVDLESRGRAVVRPDRAVQVVVSRAGSRDDVGVQQRDEVCRS